MSEVASSPSPGLTLPMWVAAAARAATQRLIGAAVEREQALVATWQAGLQSELDELKATHEATKKLHGRAMLQFAKHFDRLRKERT